MINLIVDSGCDVSLDAINHDNCNLSYVPLNLQLEDKVYLDDESLNIEDYLNDMANSSTGVKTSAPSPNLFYEMFKSAGENVFVVTLSSKLSATYQSAMTAKRMYLEECSKKFIHIFDSLSASVGQGVIAMKISELLKKGSHSAEEIVDHVNGFMKGVRTYFILDKYDNLVKTGRINPYIAKLASFLNIKPICGDSEGEIKMVDKARGYGKAVSKLVEFIKNNTPDIEERILAISHCKCYEKAVALKDEVLKHVKVKDVIIEECKGVIATYANRGGVVVAV
ncbi:MAG: DegV family protein [Defluviitaleaceae bacterium]|nr:DegV family protein [Defluviitaleaceae bacterium]